MNDTGELINDLEDRIMKSPNLKSRQEFKKKKKESNIKDLWDNIKCDNTHNRNPRRGRKTKGDWKCFWRNYGWKSPKPRKQKFNIGSIEAPLKR